MPGPTSRPARRRVAQRLRAALLLCTALAFSALHPAQAQAQEGDPKASRQESRQKRQGKRVRIQQLRSSSDETTAERDRRLYRECQGRPNAGACAGYTQAPPPHQRRRRR